MIIILSVIVFISVTNEYNVSEKLKKRYLSLSNVIETPRTQIYLEGLTKLDSHEYLFGAGLSSVIVSGPHNDYVRWWQRVGFFVMLVGFFPFLIALGKTYLQMHSFGDNALEIFQFLFLLFIVYHSFFGYPREDVFQAPYCFLGLAIWLGLLRKRMENTFLRKMYFIS